MLELVIPAVSHYDEESNKFIESESGTLVLEHSLLSISKWEAKWKKPFLTKAPKTQEETMDYIRCMTINKNAPKNYTLTLDMLKQVNEYINDEKTATWFNKNAAVKGNGPGSRRTITSELIYYWMIANNIPVEFEKWHISRLLTLIKVCNVESEPAKKMSQKELAARNKSLNAKRRAALHSRG